MDTQQTKYAIKTKKGYLCIQGDQQWYQDEPIGWAVVDTDMDYLRNVAAHFTNRKEGHWEIVPIQ